MGRCERNRRIPPSLTAWLSIGAIIYDPFSEITFNADIINFLIEDSMFHTIRINERTAIAFSPSFK